SINIFVKTGKKKANELGEVLHYDLYGKRELKYDFLTDNSIKTVDFVKLKPEEPFYFFIQKNKEGLKEYNNGFKIDELFPLNVTGVVTARDSVVVDFNGQSLIDRMQRFTSGEFSDIEIRSWLFPNKKNGKYLAGDSRGWKLVEARKKIANNHHQEFIKNFDYRPFDTRKIYYSSDMVDWGREKYMYNIITGDNLNLITARQSTDTNWSLVQITENMIDNRFHFSYKGIPSQFPLYLYSVSDGQQTIEQSAERTPNLKAEIVNQIANKLGLTFTNEKETTENTFSPIDILDYIYAVLHSPTYRDKFKEFLKIDFPRVPYPKDQDTFWALVKLGGEIRQIHLLESPKVEQYITQYPMDGDNLVVKP